MRSGVAAAFMGLALCLPCLVPLLLAAGIGAGAFTMIGAWFSDNSLMLGGAAAAVVSFVGLTGVIYARRPRTASDRA